LQYFRDEINTQVDKKDFRISLGTQRRVVFIAVGPDCGQAGFKLRTGVLVAVAL
jgi:hypothetical protein